MPVQRVCRPDHSFRGFEGQIESGSVNTGDTVTILPSGERANVKSILAAGKPAASARKGQPVTICLDREVDVSRGCVLSVGSNAKAASSITATLLWMDNEELEGGKQFFAKIGTKMVPGIVTSIEYAIDVNTGAKKQVAALSKNEIAVCRISLADKIVVDEFSSHKTLGELILIDRVTNMTSACGIVTKVAADGGLYSGKIDRHTRAVLKGQRAVVAEFPLGEDGFDRKQIEDVEKELAVQGRHTYLYEPKAGEDALNVVKHLQHAGILVLLAVGGDVKGAAEQTSGPMHFIIPKEDRDKQAAEIAAYIRRISSYAAEVSEGGEYI